MKVKIGQKEFYMPDDTLVEPWLTVVEQDGVCRIVLSTVWGHSIELIEYLIKIGLTSSPLFVIPKIVFMTNSGKYIYHNVFVSIEHTASRTITLESDLGSMEVGMQG